jgi:hypothetical protein
MNALLIRIRLVGTDRFVSNRLPSYAIVSDQELSRRSGRYDYYAEGGVNFLKAEKYAKVWSSMLGIRHLCPLDKTEFRASENKRVPLTYSRYEVVYPDGSSRPLDEVLHD